MPRDSRATKQRILETATREFAAHGLAGARVDRIAEHAGANKERVYAYFGPKRALFETVLGTRLREAAEASIPIEPLDIAAHVGQLFDQIADDPEALRLLLWEALQYPTGPVPQEEARAQHHQRLAGLLTPPDAPDDLDFRHLSFMIHSMVAWWFAAPHLARMHIGVDTTDAAAHERHRALLVRLATQISNDRR